jgi:hypothetical protein
MCMSSPRPPEVKPLPPPPPPPPPAPPPTATAEKVEPSMDNAGRDAGEARLRPMRKGRSSLRIDLGANSDSGLNVPV